MIETDKKRYEELSSKILVNYKKKVYTGGEMMEFFTLGQAMERDIIANALREVKNFNDPHVRQMELKRELGDEIVELVKSLEI